MDFTKEDIGSKVFSFLQVALKECPTLLKANQKMFDTCGITDFFATKDDLEFFKGVIASKRISFETDRTEFGDFQTNDVLSNKITVLLEQDSVNPRLIIEPTCGRGSFILACLNTFKHIEKILAVEIYKPYIWHTKFAVLQFFIDNPKVNKPEILINHCDVFDFDFDAIATSYIKEQILIIGNPPWVTNSKLSSLQSSNLPIKSNFKNHSGFDAITGKGNFDIGEYITLMMFDAFQKLNGTFAFLIKNSVIKNIVFDQKQCNYSIADLKKLSVDSKKEFNASVEASLFYCKLNQNAEYTCKEFDFDNKSNCKNQFGWVRDKFVSSIQLYEHSSDIDGLSPFVWRQGIKHDLSSIMELEREDEHFINGLQERVDLEEDLVFGLLKSSDLKQPVIDTTRKYTIVTQRKVGQDTSFIKREFPKTYDYLNKKKSLFESRKSSIYNNKPDFSIFGIGDYSFTSYKISISGLYKKYFFNLVVPQDGKPIMLDDTCYLLPFDNLEYAAYTLILLNSDKTKELLQAITFSDAKRTFTKDILMRIDLLKLALQISESKLKAEIDILNHQYSLKVKLNNWKQYIQAMKPIPELNETPTLF